MDPKDVFLLHLQLVEDLARSVCRRNALYGADADDFTSSVKLRFLENDYALLRKFEGRSELGTYLAAVVAKLFSDYRNAHWGRQRPSASAKQLGPLAIRLELLMRRAKCSLAEATEILRSAGERIPRAQELAFIATRIRNDAEPEREELNAEELASTESSEWMVVQGERERLRQTVQEALHQALQGLEPEDELILWLHHWEGLSVTDIARTLRRSAQPLYRRIRRLYPDLRTALESRGVRPDHVEELLQTADEAG